MAPHDLVKRLQECKIDWFAITDHNTMANCPAYAAVAEAAGLFFSWGVEIQTSEEIHILAYFDAPKQAQDFDKELYSSLLPLENDPDYFGDQVVIDENENIIRVEQRALINSSLWDLSLAVERIRDYGGFAVPAHVDAGVNSIISQLGFMPDEPAFDLFGVTAGLDMQDWRTRQPYFARRSLLKASDAHYLADIGSGYSELYLEEPTVAELRKAALNLDRRIIKI
jgi:hypothetical protein